MPSILKAKNADLTLEERQKQMRYQWNPHCGAKQRARNLRRAQQAALQAQRDGCEWLTDTQSLPGAPAPADASQA